MPEQLAYQPPEANPSPQIPDSSLTTPDSAGLASPYPMQIESPTIESTHTPEKSQKILDYEAEIQESGQPHFYTGYGQTFYQQALAKRQEQLQGQEINPQEAQDLQALFQEIDRQMMENLTIVESTKFPGVSYTKTTLTINSEALQKIYQTQPATKDGPVAPSKSVAVFASLAVPPEGHALTPGDIIVDRFIKESTPVATGSLSQVTIEAYGSPTSLGGQVTPEFHQAMLSRGEQAMAELYSEEFSKIAIPEGFDALSSEEQAEAMANQQILLQGASRGAIVAKYLGESLPQAVQDSTQILMNNPAGHHGSDPVPLRAVKGAQAAVGVAGEFLASLVASPTMKSLMAGPPLEDYIKRHLALPQKDPQSIEKLKVGLAEGLSLVRGHIIDKKEQDAVATYVAQAFSDPLSWNIKRVWVNHQKSLDSLAGVQSEENEQRVYLHQGTHFFSPYLNSNRHSQLNQANRRALTATEQA